MAEDPDPSVQSIEVPKSSGIDIGSGNFSGLKKPEMLMFIGGNTSSSLAGQIFLWTDPRRRLLQTLASFAAISFAKFANVEVFRDEDSYPLEGKGLLTRRNDSNFTTTQREVKPWRNTQPPLF